MSDVTIEEAFAKLPLFEQERLIEKLHSNFRAAAKKAEEADEELFSLKQAAVLVKAYHDGDPALVKLFNDIHSVEIYIEGIRAVEGKAWMAAFGDNHNHPWHDATDRAWRVKVPVSWDGTVTSDDDTGLEELYLAYRTIFPDSKRNPELVAFDEDDRYSWEEFGQTVQRELNWDYVLRDESRTQEKLKKLLMILD